ncbi:MAG: LacI family DNA-binding transcriptional regulator [Phycisphaeraceae bacterium]|nr:LacI family DNA-binding transcriptional regulator [Phycisphaeraceae bacterium]
MLSRQKPSDAATATRPWAVSIQDVATAAGVSTATVSRVLNSPNLVASETAAKVQQVIRELGYRPNAFARSLTTRRTEVLGIALPDIHGDFYSELLRGADDAAREQGYHLLVSSEARHSDGKRDASLGFGIIGGLALMITEPNEELWAQVSGFRIPLVVLDANIDSPGVDSVVIDHAVGARQATEHLLDGGDPARCYFVGGPAGNFDTQERAQAFVGALGARGAKPRTDQIMFGEYAIEWGQDWGDSMAAAGHLRGASILAGNDEIALGILQRAADAGLSAPNDLRVIGFDDTRLASLVRPRLSTVRVPMAEAGRAAVTMLVKRIDSPSAPRSSVRLETSLIVRESSATNQG